MQMEEATQPPSQSSIPHLSKLDHLEFIMKYLERKEKYCGNNNAASAEKQSLPLDLDAKDAYSKSSLLDRVVSLEHRLFQLCLEMDSSSSSRPLSRASTQTSGESSSSQRSKPELLLPLPTFNNLPTIPDQKAMPHNHITTLQVQGKSERVQHQMQNATAAEQQKVKNKPKTKSKKGEKKSKPGKKKNPRSWLHLNLFGCS